ncbi:FAD-dependent oxidoreductase [soil metagenome]
MTNDTTLQVDLLVFGSGAGGLAAAVFAAQRGMRVLLCEKSAQLGGTTATSGGVVWIPGSPQAQKAGIADSAEAVRTYLKGEAGELYREDLVATYLAHGVPALQALERAGVHFDLIDMPDYHSAAPGGLPRGRSLQARTYDGRELGADFEKVRPPISNLLVLGGMMLGPDDVTRFVRPFASFPVFSRVVRRVLRHLGDRLRGYSRGTVISNGNAMVARMFAYLRKPDTGAQIWLSSPLASLVKEGGRVVGAVVTTPEGPRRVDARLGVVLATGGFPHSPALRAEFAPDFPHAHSMAFGANTGDGIGAARAVGGQVDSALKSPGLWTPASELSTSKRKETFIYGYLDRGRPGVIAVDGTGRRFVNESNSYHDIVLALFERKRAGQSHCYFICDADFVHRRGLGAVRPWPWNLVQMPQMLRDGYLLRANTLAELASRAGIDPVGLEDEVRRHNAFCTTGIDTDFGKGDTAYNHSWGDPSVKPNPNLAPIARGPFYALAIVPATLGTAIGLETDAQARVVDAAGAPIPGLYACGNELASMMRGAYPGGGITLGPAITFAHAAVSHAQAAQP